MLRQGVNEGLAVLLGQGAVVEGNNDALVLPGEWPADRIRIGVVVWTPFSVVPPLDPDRFGPDPTGPGMPGYMASQMPSRSSRTSMTWALTPNLGAMLSPKADRTPS